MPELDDLFVDVGMQPDAAKEAVQIGDPVTLDQDFTRFGDYVTAKALDNRVSIYTLVEALRRAGETQAEIYAVATSQEEIGLRGATTAAHRIAPDIGVAIDVTLACDVPGVKKHQHITRAAGRRRHQDPRLLVHRGAASSSSTAARSPRTHGIPYQMEILPRGGTDAGGIQRAADAVPSITVLDPDALPAQHRRDDLRPRPGEATVELLARFLETAHRGRHLVLRGV